MSAGHTSGPFEACDPIKLDGVFYSDGKSSVWEAEVQCGQGYATHAITYGKTPEEAGANARLIAAAADLLDACIAVSQSSMRNEAYDKCIAAIARATDQGEMK